MYLNLPWASMTDSGIESIINKYYIKGKYSVSQKSSPSKSFKLHSNRGSLPKLYVAGASLASPDGLLRVMA